MRKLKPVVSAADPVQPRLMDIPAVALYLNIKVSAVRRLIWDGKLKKIDLGTRSIMVEKSDVDSLIDKLRGAA